MSLTGKWDGRWLVACLLVVYYAGIFSGGAGDAVVPRWRTAGVYAYRAPFLDLHVFPAAQATVAAGADLYGPNATDPLQRPFNYPRVWLVFMRFPASETLIRMIGCVLAVTALAAVLAFWGRLSPREGLFGGALLCSPAIQLGVERGNTDLAILTLVVIGLYFAVIEKLRPLAAAWWWTAAVLKLYPILAFGASFEGSWQTWWRRVWLPLVLFAAYLFLIRADLFPLLHNTGTGWIQSYGSLMLAKAATQALAFRGQDGAAAIPLAWAGPILAVAGVTWLLHRGRPQRRLPTGGGADARPSLRMLLGFRVGALIYLGTFLAGSSFDYRQCFLLLALPQLFAWHRSGHRLAAAALVALFFALEFNYLLAGWLGFFLNEMARPDSPIGLGGAAGSKLVPQ